MRLIKLAPRRPEWLAFALALTALLALPSLAQAAFPGTNGKIAFQSDRTGNYEIFTMNPDGTAPANVSNHPAHDFGPAWSSNGTQIAFESWRSSAADIYRTSANGGTATPITTYPEQQSYPAWSPDGTKIAFNSRADTLPNNPTEVFTANVDGSGPLMLTTFPFGAGNPAWSPDGTKIAFAGNSSDEDSNLFSAIWVMNSDGSGQVRLTDAAGYDSSPNWSPDGTKIAFDRAVGDQEEIFVMNPDGTGQVNVTNDPANHDDFPAWSPDGTKIAFSRESIEGEASEVFTMNSDGTARTNVTNNPAQDWKPDWQPRGYARPRGATPFRASLVIAYRNCTAPNEQHGPSLAFPSCAPPVQESNWLTVGTSDSNGQEANFVGSLRLDTLVGDPATPADEADVATVMNITDVRNKTDLTDYTGGVQANAALRITDRFNSVSVGGGTDGATVVDIPFPIDAACSATADPAVGSTCSVSSSFDAIVAGAVKEGRRSIWQLGAIEVSDGGSDGNPASLPNTVFARQGVFVP